MRLTSPAAAPAIILVRPQLGANIGACARAMLNFGLVDLRLVSPRDGWPNPEAGPTSSGADAVLHDAKLFANVTDAVADLTLVYAATVRNRALTRPVLTPHAAASAMRTEVGQSGVMFGPERSGLETEDLAISHAILTVPVNPNFASLNLAQSVAVTAYEWFCASNTPPETTMANYEGPATHDEVEGLIGVIDERLRIVGYYAIPGRAEVARLILRNLLTRPAFSSNEVRTLRGVVRALAREPRDA